MKIPLLHFRVVMWVKLVAQQRKLQLRRAKAKKSTYSETNFPLYFSHFSDTQKSFETDLRKITRLSGKLTGKKVNYKSINAEKLLVRCQTSTVSLFWSPQKEKWKNHRHSPTSVWRVWSESRMETHLENGKIHCVVLCAFCFFLISLLFSFGRSFHFPSLHMNKLHYSSHEDDLWDVRQSVSFRLLIL